MTPRVDRLVIDGTQVRAVETEGGRSFDVAAVVVAPRFIARTALYEELGGERMSTPFGEQIAATDARGATSVPGVWVAGNASELAAMIAASGAMVGAAVHGNLAVADLAQAVRARREPFSVAGEARTMLGDRPHGI